MNKAAVDLSVAALTGHQLFFANMERSVRDSHRPTARAANVLPPSPITAPMVAPGREWTQGLLFDLARDCRRASSRDPARDPQFLERVLHQARLVAEHNGWPPRTLEQVCRGLRMLASCHDPGERVRASTVTTMCPSGVPGLRVLEVLLATGEGLVIEDRTDSLTSWIEERFHSLPPQIRQELQTWISVLRNGTSRRRARPRRTTFARLANVHPFLFEIATRYDTLREVTRTDVTTWLEGRKHQANDASALRDLFRTLKSERLVFTNPTHRIRVGGLNQSTPTALSPETLQQLGEAADHSPALRVVLALIGLHAHYPIEVRRLRLDRIDLHNHRLNTGVASRPLDPFTAEAIARYLEFRQQRWPHTSNPHLLLTRRTAHEQTPVSDYWLSRLFHDLPATPRQLREDRILEEARATGADPLHLATMFGFGGKTGLRYAQAAQTPPIQLGS